MPIPFAEFSPREQKKGACGHVLDVLDKDPPHILNGKEVCSDCYYDPKREVPPFRRNPPRGAH